MTSRSEPRVVTVDEARRIAVAAALLGNPPLKPTVEGVVEVARHFGGIQIDPTRTVERTQHLVLWSRIRDYDRKLLDKVLAERRAFEYAAFIMTPDRLPELRYFARTVYAGKDKWRQKARRFIETNAAFRQSIIDQLRANGPLQSRDLDDSEGRMERSVEVAAVILFGILGLSHILQPTAWAEFFILLRGKGEVGAFVDGFLNLPLASLIVGFHNTWAGIPLVLTLVGWGLLVKSLIRFCAPKQALKVMARVSLERSWEFQVAGALLVTLAGVLGYGLYAG